MRDFLRVGKLVNTQGIKGDVRIISTSDFTEDRFQNGQMLYLVRNGEELAQVEVERHYRHKAFYILHFKGYDNINDVLGFKPCEVLLAADERLDSLDKDAYYYTDIIGLSVYDEAGDCLGHITDIIAYPANDVWVLKTSAGKEVLLPYIADVVKSIDLNKGQVIIDPLEGLF